MRHEMGCIASEDAPRRFALLPPDTAWVHAWRSTSHAKASIQSLILLLSLPITHGLPHDHGAWTACMVCWSASRGVLFLGSTSVGLTYSFFARPSFLVSFLS